MSRIEDRVRDSLRQRAEDVDATPALWHEVDRRIARRRRLQVTSWSVSFVAAALVALLVLPGLLAMRDPGGLEIEPMGPAGGVVPGIAVVVGSDGLALLELTTGGRTALDIPVDGPVHQLAVRPGSTAEHFDIAVVHLPEGYGATTTLVYGRSGTGVASTAEESNTDGFVPTIRWSPTGDHVAYTEPDGDGRVRLLAQPSPTAPDDTGQDGGADALDGFLNPAAATRIGTLGADDLLLDWVRTEEVGLSELWVRQVDGTVGVRLLQAEGSSFSTVGDGELQVADGWGGSAEASVVRDVVAAVSSHPAAGTGGPPLYLLAPGAEDGASLYWSGRVAATGESPVTEVPLDSRVGDADLTELWLDGAQDAAVVGDGRQTLLFIHDGHGVFGPALEVPDAKVVALFDVPGPDSVEREPDNALDPP